MTIRLARPLPHEAGDLAALHVACWREAYAGIVPQEILAPATASTRLAMWTAALANPDQIATAAYDGAEPVGFILAGPPLEPPFEGVDGQIPAFYIRASHYRRGIGRRLLADAAARWLARGGHSLTLGVLAGNVRARAFYEALGARLVRTGTYDWDGVPLPDAIYVFEPLEALGRLSANP